MATLTTEKCTACRRDAPPVTKDEIAELALQIPDWILLEREGSRFSACLKTKRYLLYDLFGRNGCETGGSRE
jgi:hypothetical protein